MNKKFLKLKYLIIMFEEESCKNNQKFLSLRHLQNWGGENLHVLCLYITYKVNYDNNHYYSIWSSVIKNWTFILVGLAVACSPYLQVRNDS